MYCKNCGAEVNDNADTCLSCGSAVIRADENDKGGFGWGLLGFLIPIVGLILYLIWKNEKPRTAGAAGKGALISVIISVVLTIISAVLTGLAVSM